MTVGFVERVRAQAGGALEEGPFRSVPVERRVSESGRSALAFLPSLSGQVVREAPLVTALPDSGGSGGAPFPVSIREGRRGFPFVFSLGASASRSSTGRNSLMPLPVLGSLQRTGGEAPPQAPRASCSPEFPSPCRESRVSSQGADDSALRTAFTESSSPARLDGLFRVSDRSDCLRSLIEDAKSLIE
jgi:hypothetical protein